MNQRVLGVAAHPDDLEWYAGGTIAKFARGGAEITFVICTDGSKGSYDPNVDVRQLAAQREVEQRDAARMLGIRDAVFLGYVDGELEATTELRRKLAMLYRKYQPQFLLAFDPWKRYELHPDHLAVGRAALDARVAARMPLFHPELHRQGYNAWAIGEVWLFNADIPNHYVDVSDTLEMQMRALAQHRSQSSVWDPQARAFVEGRAREHGQAAGVEYAEAFRRIVIEGALIVAGGTRS